MSRQRLLAEVFIDPTNQALTCAQATANAFTAMAFTEQDGVGGIGYRRVAGSCGKRTRVPVVVVGVIDGDVGLCCALAGAL